MSRILISYRSYLNKHVCSRIPKGALSSLLGVSDVILGASRACGCLRMFLFVLSSLMFCSSSFSAGSDPFPFEKYLNEKAKRVHKKADVEDPSIVKYFSVPRKFSIRNDIVLKQFEYPEPVVLDISIPEELSGRLARDLKSPGQYDFKFSCAANGWARLDKNANKVLIDVDSVVVKHDYKMDVDEAVGFADAVEKELEAIRSNVCDIERSRGWYEGYRCERRRDENDAYGKLFSDEKIGYSCAWFGWHCPETVSFRRTEEISESIGYKLLGKVYRENLKEGISNYKKQEDGSIVVDANTEGFVVFSDADEGVE